MLVELICTLKACLLPFTLYLIFSMMAEKYVLLPAGLKRTYKKITKSPKKVVKVPRGFRVSPITSGLTQAELEKQIQSVLKKKNMLDYEKWKLLSQLSLRAIRDAATQRETAAAAARAAIAGPSSLSKIGNQTRVVKKSGGAKTNEDIMPEVVGFTHGRNKVTAKGIIDFLSSPEQTPPDRLTWDSTGRVIIDGKLIHNSNISELISDMLKPNKSVITSVVGDKQLKSVLHKLNFPHNLVNFKRKYYTPDEFKVLREQEAKVAEKKTGKSASRTRSGQLYGSGRSAAKVRWIKCTR
jgi:hypothetical protein